MEVSYTFIGFILYLLIVLVVGFWSYTKNKSSNDFFIADRKLNPWIVAFSERASGESAWLLLGLPGAAFSIGLIEIWTALGCVIGIIIYWFVASKGIRIMSEKHNAITLPNYFAENFKEGKTTIRITALVIIIFFFTFYLAAQINGAGKVLHVTFEWPHLTGMIIGAVVIVFYTMMGGFFAVAFTDLFQGIIMIATLIILPIVGFYELSQLQAEPEITTMIKENELFSLTGGKTGYAAFAVIIGGLSWAFGYLGQPHLLTRFMAINDPEKIKISRRIAFFWAIPGFTGAFLIGIIGLKLGLQNQVPDAEHIMPFLANSLLPAWLAGIFISGAIAAMMSTADSQLLVISSSFVEDFYHKVLGYELTQENMLLISRIVTFLVGAGAFFIAYTSEEMIFGLVAYAWSGLGASFGPVVICLLYVKRMNWQATVAGMVTGTVTTIVWSNLPELDQMLSVRVVSFILAFVMIFVFRGIFKKSY